uniref:Uncharacterized protein n=1 Tax=Glossina pallidipes TaxID=7398 RepID=A0A1A9ZWF0_GLOPL
MLLPLRNLVPEKGEECCTDLFLNHWYFHSTSTPFQTASNGDMYHYISMIKVKSIALCKRAVLTNPNASLIGCVVKVVETVKAMVYHNKHSNLLMLAKLNLLMSSYYCTYQLIHC